MTLQSNVGSHWRRWLFETQTRSLWRHCNVVLVIHYLNQRNKGRQDQLLSSHYSDVIMNAMVSQITGILIVCSTVSWGPDQRKHQSSMSLAFVRGIDGWMDGYPGLAPCRWPLCGEFTGTGEFPAQMASNAESVSIWWRHHAANERWHYIITVP